MDINYIFVVLSYPQKETFCYIISGYKEYSIFQLIIIQLLPRSAWHIFYAQNTEITGTTLF